MLNTIKNLSKAVNTSSNIVQPSKSDIIKIYRQLLKSSKGFTTYNFREYTIRRVKDAFRSNRDVKDSEEIVKLFNKAKENLEVIHRQTTISSLFTADKLVIEKLKI